MSNVTKQQRDEAIQKHGIHTGMQRTAMIESLGINPLGQDDTVFGTELVYCGAHLSSHNAGWCTGFNVNKIPIFTDTTISEDRDATYAAGHEQAKSFRLQIS